MTGRLSQATIGQLPAGIARPAYDRTAVCRGVVHLGLGAFHRAHQAVVFDDCLAAGDGRWAITGVSLRSANVHQTLAPQNGLYSLAVRSAAASTTRVIGAVREVLVAPSNPEAVIAAMADVSTHIVTLTITEKGYKLHPVSGALLADDPDVQHDLVDLTAPRTAAGLIVAALARRRADGLNPFTAISCDNLTENGSRLRAAVTEIAQAHDHDLARWITQCGAFPRTMVDRMVPATDAIVREQASAALGMNDAAAVAAEPFLQWIIEERFAGARPTFVTPRVVVTPDVAPWEEAKLRLLNGAHSAIAYLGAQGGIETVDAFIGMPEARRFVDALWMEIIPTLTPPRELDLSDYCAALMERFGNPALHHQTRQIAMDGSLKLPQRLFGAITARIYARQSFDALALAVAAWMHWARGVDDLGNRHALEDPQADAIAAALSGAETAADRTSALLRLAMFPDHLAANTAFRVAVAESLEALEIHGSLGWLRTCFANGAT